MEFIGLKIGAFLIWTVIAWYVGKRWQDFNSVSDVETQYKNVVSAVSTEIANAEAAAKTAADKAASLKALVTPSS